MDPTSALAAVQASHGLPVVPADWARERMNHGLLLAAYAWACGVPFVDVAAMADVPEGHIVRTVTRMEEACREVRNAARILGDPRLYRKMELASAAIRRDVCFQNSLYLD